MSAGPSGPSVSLLMPNRNNVPLLDRVLERLAVNTTYPNVELVLIDDGSTDSSVSLLRRWRDSGRFAHFELLERQHMGAIAALNAGLEAAGGELVVQLDADASVETPGWLERMVALIESDARIGVVTAKVVFDSGELQSCGVEVIGPAGLHGRGTVVTEPVGKRTYHERVARARDGECAECERVAEVDAGQGTCMLYRRDAAVELGGYDPRYSPVWFDDVDLTIGIRRSGLKVFFTPEVRIVHHVDAASAARGLVRGVLPARVRHRIARRLDVRPREQRERLAHHYDYWRTKWGFDLLNPDMEAVAERWGDTELCWRLNAGMRAAGEEIAARFAAAGQ